ncbi:MAG TPA: efflux transporter periplasmic adaptor subunit [Oxalobacteraceae bacterium]|nr:efflux transporter periplasmic adaptor subunit [Oxalobacteraceae bacterium]
MLAGSLAACSKPAPKVEEIRPVRVLRTAAQPVDVVAEFPGEVRPRIESRLGFRVGGKIIARKVDVGATVKRGQVLMQLDPQDLQLAQAQAYAGLKAAESNHQLAKAELARYQELRNKNFVSQAVLDGKNTAYQATRASYDQAAAAYRNQSNMAGYATLVADADGVVAGIDAEAGQVVAAGTPVLRLAQLGEKEIVIGIPEDKVEALRRISDVRVRIWAIPDQDFAGRIREIAPVADPATRTYAARIAIPEAPPGIKLGMTAYVSFASTGAQAMLRLPLSALFQDKSGSAVWVVENGAVRLVPVQLAGPTGNEVLIAGGLAPGQTVVTAGVNLLKAGQKVKILGADDAGEATVTASTQKNGAAK